MSTMNATEYDRERSEAALLRDRRFKLSRACDRCRRRRIKCDEGHPCKSCSNSNSECTFDEMHKKTIPHVKSKRSTLEDRLQQIEALIHALPSGLFNPSLPESSIKASVDLPPIAGPSLGLPSSARNLVNPSKYFTTSNAPSFTASGIDGLRSDMHSTLPLSSSYLYFDDQGSTRWQGEMSGFPLLDMLLETEASTSQNRSESPESSGPSHRSPLTGVMDEDMPSPAPTDWFPDRDRIPDGVLPQDIWNIVTPIISPELMDSLVKCWFSTTYYLMPFIHVPTFMADYANPNKWDTGLASFVVAICCLTSRHVDDIRVRSDPSDAFSAGASYFDLFQKVRTLPGADRPTLYTVQGVLLAAVYAIGLGRLSKGLALLSEAVALCIDAGLHRSVDQYDYFDPIETEVRKRTFWSVYAWDKQASAYFGRPPVIRMRDCDVPEPLEIDDEYLTAESLGSQPAGKAPLMSAFIACNRLYIIMEAVLDVHPVPQQSSFLAKASSALSGFRQSKDLREAESLLDEWCEWLPPYWAVTPETMASRDVVRITQAERLHCMEHFIRMLIHRYRLSQHIISMTPGSEGARDVAMRLCQRSASQIIAKYLEISSLGLMTYYGLFVIHQLTQAGRSLIATLLICKTDTALITSSLEALKACVGLLRRFSGRYVCGLRSADLLEEICRLSHIPLEVLEQPMFTKLRPAWLRPVRKRNTSRHRASLDPNIRSTPVVPNNGEVLAQASFNIPEPTIEGQLDSSLFAAQMLQGGLFEPLTQGTVAPLTADMFGSDDVTGFSADDLLALLGGAVPDASSLGYSLLQPPTPLLASGIPPTGGLPGTT